MAIRSASMLRSRLRGGAVAAVIAPALLASAPAPALAVPPGTGFALSSGALSLKGTPGRTMHGTVLLRNLSSHSCGSTRK